MEKYYKRKPPLQEEKGDQLISSNNTQSEINLAELPSDPGVRPGIMTYHPNVRDEVRRAYLLKGPCQPRDHDFPSTKFGIQNRRFNDAWFDEHGSWLEYSISKDAAYCLCCYLFKQDIISQTGGEHFVSEGFTNWKRSDKFALHVGRPNSPHNICWGKCQYLMNRKQHIETLVSKKSDQDKAKYKMRLNTSIEVTRYLSMQGLAFRGHDESESSSNKGNFIELVKVLGRINPEIKLVTLENAPSRQMLTCPKIQKDIVRAYALETMKIVLSDVGDAHFCLMVDEARDTSIKEQMAMVIRYVDRKGHVTERYLGVEHVTDTSALTLKITIDGFLSRHGLSISKLRGQGYDGASNMRGEFNGLKTLILNENPCAYYIHCFAHQLQLALVAVARKHDHITSLFDFIARVLNVVGSSSKRRDLLREKQYERIVKALNIGEISSGQGLHQETSLKRSGDTRWGSHYNTLLSLTNMFGAVIDVLEIIGSNASNTNHRTEAQDIVERLLSFDLIFSLLLMKKILAITNELSQALQQKDQDIVNAMALVQVSKFQLQTLRDDGWNSLLDSVSTFCEKYGVSVPEMDTMYRARGRRRRNEEEMTNLHHYRHETFYTIMDMQLGELNGRFSDSTMELLLCIACLNPSDSFSQFDKDKLLRLAEYYPQDFSKVEKWKLGELTNLIIILLI